MKIFLFFNLALSFMVHSQGPATGCPENAFCEAFAGKIRAEWLEIVKKGRPDKIETFRRKHGIPFGFWSQKIDKKAISWNSRCPAHNTEEFTLYQTDLFIKQVPQEKDLIIEKTWRLSGNKKPQAFPISRREVPGYIDGNKIVLIREEEGCYYGLKISPTGKLKVIKYPTDIPPVQKVDCPTSLSESFAKEFNSQKIYQSHYCKKVWNIQRNKFEIMVFGWTCL